MGHTARDVMETHVLTVGLDDPLDSVRKLFFDEGIHGAPVVDEQRRVVGIISTTDLLRAAYDGVDAERPHAEFTADGIETPGLDGDGPRTLQWDSPRVQDFMTESVVSVKPSASVAEVARAMRQNQIHRVLVVEGNVLCGVVSSFDLISLLDGTQEA